DLPYVTRQVTKDIRTAGQVDELTVEANRPGDKGLVRLGRVEFFEHTRPRRVGHSGNNSITASKHVRSDRFTRVGAPVQTAEHPDRADRRVEVFREQFQHGNALATDLRDVVVAFGQSQHDVGFEGYEGFDRRARIRGQPRLNVLCLRRIVRVT